MLKKVFLCLWITTGVLFEPYGQTAKQQWVDSVFNTLDQEEKIGQLFMVPVHSRTNRDHVDEIEDAIKSHYVGGVIFMDGSPWQVGSLVNHIQQYSKVPLLTAIDAEWGLGKRLDSTMTFPQPLALGAVMNDTLIYRMGAEIGRQMQELGLHFNLGPNAGLARSNKSDTVDYMFGDNRFRVTEKALAYLNGIQSQKGVFACGKYFPVEGITVTGVHHDGFPVLNPYIDTIKVDPFKKLFDAGLNGILPATSEFPLFYKNRRLIKKNQFSPTLLSSIYAGDWLKKHLNYQGLVFVDIAAVQGHVKKSRGGDAELLAFMTGNEVIMFPQDINPAVRRIKRLLRKEAPFRERLDRTVKKILAAKYDAGLHRPAQVNVENLVSRLNTKEAYLLKKRMLESVVTVVSNKNDVLPLKILDEKKIAALTIGYENPEAFHRTISKYAGVTSYFIRHPQDTTALEELRNYNTIVVGLFPSSATWKHPILATLESWQAEKEIILCQLGSPLYLKETENFNTIVAAYTAEEDMQRVLPQAIFGSLPMTGSLPLNISPALLEGQGQRLPAIGRLGYSIPEDAGMDSRILEKIDAIAREAIDAQATPGCHVLIAKDGKVVYEKSFGSLTYKNEVPVTGNTIYDLASVTKVMATLQTVMFMHDKKLIDIYKKASCYLPELRNSNKKDFTIKDILTHQAGLWPFLPFWAQTVKDTVLMPQFYSRSFGDDYPLAVAENIYANKTMRDSLWGWIVNAKIREKPVRTPFDYRYSDMGFYILQHLAEKVLNQPMEDFLAQNLYDPLGAASTGYLPLNRFAKTQIAPTEDDKLFRRRLLVGTVHDQGAAMHGGVAGHAGLFSNANDLAKIAQMLLQNGYYGGLQYFSPHTVQLFSQKQYASSRRGLGWDKPLQSDWNSPTSLYASPKTFGHTGFTGTCVWIDPEFSLVYIFLSNRVHPDMTNNKLLHANIRSRIQDVIYRAIFSYCEN